MKLLTKLSRFARMFESLTLFVHPGCLSAVDPVEAIIRSCGLLYCVAQVRWSSRGTHISGLVRQSSPGTHISWKLGMPLLKDDHPQILGMPAWRLQPTLKVSFSILLDDWFTYFAWSIFAQNLLLDLPQFIHELCINNEYQYFWILGSM